MKITISKKDFKKEQKKEKSTEKEMIHSKNATSQAKNFIKRNNTYKLEEKEQHTNSNFTYLFYFLFIVFVAVFVAGLWKLFIVFNNNAFSGSSFSVYVYAETSAIISVNKEEKKMAIIEVKNENKNKVSKSVSLHVPIDATITAEQILPHDIFSFPSIFSYIFKVSNIKLKSMTIFDYGKFTFVTSSIDTEDRREESLQVKDGIPNIAEEELFDMFKDSEIIKEGLSVEIINATDTNGLAGAVSNILTPVGVNVVSLSSEGIQDKSVIKSSLPSKTTSRISRLLEIPHAQEQSNSVADITIILGQDFAKKVR